ncbi:MAG: hypothetical protein OEV07_17365 [Gammaproteobacteria bacterium]|nr:hypothetical protein [Gammaproteobacteria bacterium]
MHPRFYAILLALGCLAWGSVQAVETRMLTLQNNPFSRPEVLKPKPPPAAPAPVVVIPPEEIELDLTATMVSEIAPMAVVDGELLAIGDKIEGMKLIAVMEGKAVFARGGKKYSFEIKKQAPQ